MVIVFISIHIAREDFVLSRRGQQFEGEGYWDIARYNIKVVNSTMHSSSLVRDNLCKKDSIGGSDALTEPA